LNKIAVFGLGPVGLVTAVCFARKGYPVTGVDPDQRRVNIIQNGRPPFYEPSLAEYLKEAKAKGTFNASANSPAVLDADFVYITVGTPNRKDGAIDLAYVKAASRQIGRAIKQATGRPVVVVKSTVTPGTCRTIVRPILEKESGGLLGEAFDLCSNPEFLQEGRAVEGTEHPDRIVIGSGDAEAAKRLENLYRGFYGEPMPPIFHTGFENAELIKYANNAFLAMKVSYVNMIANLCQAIPGADVEEVAKGVGLDERIGPKFLRAGLGWGGSCFPKDLEALASFAKQRRVSVPILKATAQQNNLQPLKAVEAAQRLLGSLKGRRIALLGLAFKPDTDDMREAVSIRVVRQLLARKATVTAYDPMAVENAKAVFGNKVIYAQSANDALKDADCCIVVTEWEEFRKLTPKHFRATMRRPAVVDGRRIYDRAEFEREGVEFQAVGLGPRT